MMRRVLLALALAMAVSHAACRADNGTTSVPPTEPPAKTFPKRVASMKTRITIGERVITATMHDNATASDFISLLPLTLTLEDYAKTEKISDLPRKLTKEGAPSGSDPSVGDIAYYSPWGNLAIFYGDSGYASGLVILGKIHSSVEALNVPGSLRVTVELVK
jgi:hypothetical protein